MTLCLVNNIGTENKKNCEAKRIFHYTIYILQILFLTVLGNDCKCECEETSVKIKKCKQLFEFQQLLLLKDF